MVKYLDQEGFSLTEVLVVVAIVGILITIAVPQYEKARRKSMQTEAKVLLSKIYSVEALFINEWKYGTPNLLQMGFYPEGDIFYNVGWDSANNRGGGGIVDINTESPLPATHSYKGPYLSSEMVPPGSTFTSFDEATNTRTMCERVLSSCAHTGPQTGGTNRNKFGFGSWNSSSGNGGPEVDNSAASTGGKVEFAIGARGYFTGSSSDEWIIDHKKELKHIKNGI